MVGTPIQLPDFNGRYRLQNQYLFFLKVRPAEKARYSLTPVSYISSFAACLLWFDIGDPTRRSPTLLAYTWVCISFQFTLISSWVLGPTLAPIDRCRVLECYSSLHDYTHSSEAITAIIFYYHTLNEGVFGFLPKNNFLKLFERSNN